jgi:predicted ATPase/DNA-binding SARP family transcriptional activator
VDEEAMSFQLQVHCLGSFHLTDEQGAVTIDSPIQQSLVTLLLIRRDAPQSRQSISFCLWPDSSEAQAQANLRTLLVRLRRAWPKMGQFIEITPRTLQWKSDHDYSLDVAEFEEAAKDPVIEFDLQTARQNLERAVHLYRGDLLPACYDDWIQSERERLRLVFVRAIHNLIEILEKQHDFVSAIGHSESLLKLDPLDETTYQCSMRLHALRGDRAGIVRVFETCAAVLRQELHVEPGSATREIFQSLLKQKPPAITEFPTQPVNHNLSFPLTSFIGRDREITAIKHLLFQAPPSDQRTHHEKDPYPGGTRLVTLTGVGGSGKTRLALQVAFDCLPEFTGGVWWVSLAPLADPAAVGRAIASIFVVQEQSDRPLIETLATALGSRQLLLILDNCEHLLGECARIAGHLLSACPNLKILVTSRELLGMTGETVYPVPPLSLPSALEPNVNDQTEAVRLFVERASLTLPTFSLNSRNREAVVQVCRRLDGIPLAIELAAARVKVLPVDQIASRLNDRFNLLTSGNRSALPRHQTLRAMVDWSYDLLSTLEQALFRQLSVFAGGFTLEAAQAVGSLDGDQSVPVLENLSRLIDKSLVDPEESSGETMRYRLLETIRQYAHEKLEKAGENQLAQDRHCGFLLMIVDDANQQRKGVYSKRWLDLLRKERDNLRGALEWAIASSRTETALRLVSHSAWGWFGHSEFIEGRMWLERVLGMPSANQFPEPYALALLFIGMIDYLKSEIKKAKPWLEQSLSIGRSHLQQDVVAGALDFLALIAIQERNFILARAYLFESRAIFAELGLVAGFAQAVGHLGLLAEQEGDKTTALSLYEQAVSLFRTCGETARLSGVLRMLGWNYYELGDQVRGRELFQESLIQAMENGQKAEVAHTLRAIAERIEGDVQKAVRLLGAIVSLYRSIGLSTYANSVLENDLAKRRGQLDEVTFTAAWEAGRAMTMEQAITEAGQAEPGAQRTRPTRLPSP